MTPYNLMETYRHFRETYFSNFDTVISAKRVLKFHQIMDVI